MGFRPLHGETETRIEETKYYILSEDYDILENNIKYINYNIFIILKILVNLPYYNEDQIIFLKKIIKIKKENIKNKEDIILLYNTICNKLYDFDFNI